MALIRDGRLFDLLAYGGGFLFEGGRLSEEIRYLIRDITKIRIRRLNTTSKREIKQLAISYATCMFLLFKSSRAPHT